MCLLEAALAVYVFVLSNNKQTTPPPEAYINGFQVQAPMHPSCTDDPSRQKPFPTKRTFIQSTERTTHQREPHPLLLGTQCNPSHTETPKFMSNAPFHLAFSSSCSSQRTRTLCL